MAFRDAYDRLCRDARATKAPAQWTVSPGWDKERREVALSNAVIAGYLPQAAAARFLPAPSDTGPLGRLLLGAPAIDGEDIPPDVVQRCAELRQMLKESAERRERERAEAGERERAELQRRKDEIAAIIREKEVANGERE
jgi:hypothetical protein